MLATTVEYRTVGHLFGVARCTVCCIVKDTCKAIITVVLSKYIQFPVGDALDATMDGFMEQWGIPQCVGSINGSHIPVRPPAMSHTCYHNRKGWYSVILQAIVNHEYLFTDIIYVGWPGSVHDARVFANSSVVEKIEKGQLLCGEVRNGIRPFIVGDPAYPLRPWLMKSFPHSGSLTPQQKLYNYRMCRGRTVVELAFGRLKARWRRLSKQNDKIVENVPTVIGACCILHNICQIHGDTFNEEWLQDIPNTGTITSNDGDAGNTGSGDSTREALVQYFISNPTII